MTPIVLSIAAGTMVTELLHRPWLLRTGALCLLLAEHEWDEIPTRLLHEIEDNRPLDPAEKPLSALAACLDRGLIKIVPHGLYAHQEAVARHRIPRDAGHWPVVAVAISLEVGVLTNDARLLGCGCATWTVDTLWADLTGASWFPALCTPTEEPAWAATATFAVLTPFAAAGTVVSSGTLTATRSMPVAAAGTVVSSGTLTATRSMPVAAAGAAASSGTCGL
jgi:PIN domain